MNLTLVELSITMFHSETNLQGEKTVEKNELMNKQWEHDMFKLYVDERSELFKVEKIDPFLELPFDLRIEVIDRFEHDEDGEMVIIYYLKIGWSSSGGATVDESEEFIKMFKRVSSSASYFEDIIKEYNPIIYT